MQKQAMFNLIKFRSMLGAKRVFVQRGGDVQTVGLHEGASHIGAFTRGKICSEYAGFLGDFGLTDPAVDFVYGAVMKKLVELGHTSHARNENNVAYNIIAPELLYRALNNVLDGYENRINATNGKGLSAMYAAISVGAATANEQNFLNKLNVDELYETAAHFVVFQTIKGIKLLMGENVLKYAPNRGGITSFQRINRFLEVRLS